MKRIILFFFAGLLAAAVTPAAAQDLQDKLAADACECITKKDTDNMSMDDLQMQLGLCLMEAMGSNQNAFQEKYGAFDPSDQQAMQKIGEEIGMRMITKCPQVMMRLASQQEMPQSAVPSKPAMTGSLSGTVKSIGGDEVAIVTIQEDNGRSQKLLWLDFFPGSNRLQDTGTAIGSKVTVEYEEVEIYAPKAKEYFKRKKIIGLRFQ